MSVNFEGGPDGSGNGSGGTDIEDKEQSGGVKYGWVWVGWALKGIQQSGPVAGGLAGWLAQKRVSGWVGHRRCESFTLGHTMGPRMGR